MADGTATEEETSDSSAEGSEHSDERTIYDWSQYSGVELDALRTVREESRTVLSAQVESLRAIDDKAMRTVRTSVLLIGLGISVIQVSDISISEDIGVWSFRFGLLGAAFLLLSIVIGVVTYSDSRPELGVSEGHRRDVVKGEYTEREWVAFQLDEYNKWTKSMKNMISLNVVGLNTALFTLTTGVVSLTGSAVLAAGIKISTILIWVCIAIVLAVLSVSIYYVFNLLRRLIL